MQVTETSAEGLKRELKIVVPAAELGTRLDAYLADMKDRVRIRGFRPGKVPVTHLRKVYGKSAMAEIVNTVIKESTDKALADRQERAITQPQVDLADSEAEKVLAGDTDLAFAASYEIMPSFDLQPFTDVEIERPMVEVTDEEIEQQIQRLADQQRAFEARPEGEAAQLGDRVEFGFVGKRNGETFEGGSDDNSTVVLGSGRFIPGFEDGIVGMKAGEQKTINVRFPERYANAALAGEEATFDITLKAVSAPAPFNVDDEFAKTVGVESVDRLKEILRDQIRGQHAGISRQKVKRQLLDKLDAQYAFDLPPSMVDQEFNIIWRQVLADLDQSKRTFADENTTEEDAQKEYRKIAERRVRLGLVLSKIGERESIQVTEREMQNAMQQRLRQFPNQQKELLEFFRTNPNAAASLQAPVFEEKVVDYLLGTIKVTDKTVTRDELYADEEGDEVGTSGV